jgi:hypothetical protein
LHVFYFGFLGKAICPIRRVGCLKFAKNGVRSVNSVTENKIEKKIAKSLVLGRLGKKSLTKSHSKKNQN